MEFTLLYGHIGIFFDREISIVIKCLSKGEDCQNKGFQNFSMACLFDIFWLSFLLWVLQNVPAAILQHSAFICNIYKTIIITVLMESSNIVGKEIQVKSPSLNDVFLQHMKNIHTLFSLFHSSSEETPRP